MTTEEKQLAREQANAARQRELHRPQSIQDAVRRQVAERGGNTAMVCGSRELSYLALDARSDAVARKLVEKGIGRGSIVGVFAPRGPETIAAMLGVLKAGGCYLPFDPSQPPKLLRYICEDATPVLMMVHEEHVRQSRMPQFWTCPTLDIGPEAQFEPRRGHAPMPVINGEDFAYVTYACAASGQPRGVQVPHRSVLRMVQDVSYADLGADQVILQATPLAFDASTFEIWSALLNGGKLAIVPSMNPSVDQIADTISRFNVTTAWITAGLFHHMVDTRIDALKPLKQLFAGGEVLSPAHVEKARQELTSTRLMYAYGAPENTCMSCLYTVDPNTPVTGPLPIGKPLPHGQALILDDARRPINDNREGELCVGGLSLAHGYLNRPQLTAERFCHAVGMVARLFRTGDRVRRREDGNFDLLARGDRQVKINNRRVELDAIEACLRRSGLVGDAAVITVGEVEQRRVAAFVTAPAGKAVSTGELRGYLQQELPDHMVPSVVQVLEGLPLTNYGHVDRVALAERVPAPPALAQPRSNGVEAQLLRIWREVLGNDEVGVNDSFFDLGGSSLQLEQAHAQIKATLRCEVALMDLFTYPRVNALAAYILRAEARRNANAALSKTGGWQRTMGFLRTGKVPAAGNLGVPN
jgi:amino acid adenylation domain-containing protein